MSARSRWFRRHKLAAAIIVLLVVVGVGVAALHFRQTEMASQSGGTPTSATSESAAPQSTSLSKFYDKIHRSMTKDELLKAAGRNASKCKEAEPVGTSTITDGYEGCDWLSGDSAVHVTLLDGKVLSKSSENVKLSTSVQTCQQFIALKPIDKEITADKLYAMRYNKTVSYKSLTTLQTIMDACDANPDQSLRDIGI